MTLVQWKDQLVGDGSGAPTKVEHLLDEVVDAMRKDGIEDTEYSGDNVAQLKHIKQLAISQGARDTELAVDELIDELSVTAVKE